ncbi:hypothetical protein GCM10027091_03140 [Streptomyces daliensis]
MDNFAEVDADVTGYPSRPSPATPVSLGKRTFERAWTAVPRPMHKIRRLLWTTPPSGAPPGPPEGLAGRVIPRMGYAVGPVRTTG